MLFQIEIPACEEICCARCDCGDGTTIQVRSRSLAYAINKALVENGIYARVLEHVETEWIELDPVS